MVYQIHEICDKKLQAKNMCHLVYKWGYLYCYSHFSPNYNKTTQLVKPLDDNLATKSPSRSRHTRFDKAHHLHFLVIVGKWMQHQNHM
jgi:hypothetical protein